MGTTKGAVTEDPGARLCPLWQRAASARVVKLTSENTSGWLRLQKERSLNGQLRIIFMGMAVGFCATMMGCVVDDAPITEAQTCDTDDECEGLTCRGGRCIDTSGAGGQGGTGGTGGAGGVGGAGGMGGVGGMGGGQMPEPVSCLRADPDPIRFGAVDQNRAARLELSLESCGNAPVTITNVEVVDADDGALYIDENSEVPFPWTLSAEDGDAPERALAIRFQPGEAREYDGRLWVHTDAPGSPIEVAVNGRGERNECPIAAVAEDVFEVVPSFEAIVLDGSPSTDPDGETGRPVNFEWSVVERPPASIALPLEHFCTTPEWRSP